MLVGDIFSSCCCGLPVDEANNPECLIEGPPADVEVYSHRGSRSSEPKQLVQQQSSAVLSAVGDVSVPIPLTGIAGVDMVTSQTFLNPFLPKHLRGLSQDPTKSVGSQCSGSRKSSLGKPASRKSSVAKRSSGSVASHKVGEETTAAREYYKGWSKMLDAMTGSDNNTAGSADKTAESVLNKRASGSQEVVGVEETNNNNNNNNNSPLEEETLTRTQSRPSKANSRRSSQRSKASTSRSSPGGFFACCTPSTRCCASGEDTMATVAEETINETGGFEEYSQGGPPAAYADGPIGVYTGADGTVTMPLLTTLNSQRMYTMTAPPPVAPVATHPSCGDGINRVDSRISVQGYVQ
eukprot:GHVS01020287.1.p1 GENE.GHVS01020287.1~~GHVS01020287.1.p1  ORF type:complete len:352 (-),score=73.80 GHVS01020287.1:568-1623(-)